MPGGDGTGPMGMGSRTGRGMGFCNGYNNPGFTSQGFGRRFFGRGYGMGRFRFYQTRPMTTEFQDNTPTKSQEINDLEKEKELLEQELEKIKKAVADLEKQN